MVLMIDNYDSFTYNLVQYLGELGAEVRVVRNDELSVEQALALAPRHIVVSPGPCTPNEAGISVSLIRAAAGRIPILGVCLGHQSIGRAFGGEIIKAHTVNARQDLAHPSQQHWRLRRLEQSLRGHPLSLPGGPIRQPCRRSWK